MFTWVKFILTCIDFVPMILFALLLFRQRVKPYWIQITLAALAGTMVAYFDNWPLLYVCIICTLLMIVWKFSLVPTLIIALSGYILSVIVSTIVLFCCDITDLAVYTDIKDDSLTTNLILLLTVMTKCGVLLVIHKLRSRIYFSLKLYENTADSGKCRLLSLHRCCYYRNYIPSFLSG